jgi:hypothetical protein
LAARPASIPTMSPHLKLRSQLYARCAMSQCIYCSSWMHRSMI